MNRTGGRGTCEKNVCLSFSLSNEFHFRGAFDWRILSD